MAKKPPPKSRRREMTAAFRFVEKLDSIPLPASETDVCRAAGIPENQITRWRQGKKIHLDHAVKLAKRLGLSLEWLADDTREKPPGEEMPPEMREVVKTAERLGSEVAMARLLIQPEQPGAGASKRLPDVIVPRARRSMKRQPRR